MQLQGWNLVDENAGVLWREYTFAKNASATTMVFRGVDGLVVVSPGKRMEARDFDALDKLGEVKALIANNAFHHLGQAEWRARYPNAVSYCPPGAMAKLNKKVPGAQFRPLGELKLPAHVRCEDAPGFKTGETFVSVKTGKGAVWFAGDLLTNIQRMPPPPFKWLFSWSDSAPGFRLFKPAVWFFVKNRPALRQWALSRLAEEPPAVVVPAHGPAFDAPDLAALAKAQLERL
jgi:glyoxylase-like metal-dependent hydrolase (beta-lactamase superfamily II)